MRIGVLTTARMGSKRLPDKHLRAIAGRPALSYLIERIETEFAEDIARGRVFCVLATGAEQRNRPLAELCAGNSQRIFHGDDESVPRRHLQAAEHFALDAMVSVDGDDLLCAPEAMRWAHDALAGGASLVRTAGLPLGMNSWGYSREALAAALRNASPTVLSTGWGRIFEGVSARQIDLPCTGAESVRATLDYPQDLEFFRRVITEIPGWAQLPCAELVAQLAGRGIHNENASLNSEYWDNFARERDAEARME